MSVFFDMLDHWQVLVAGGIAIPAAMVTVGAVYWQSRSDRRRKLRASRSLMPAALSLVGDYTLTTIQWLRSARLAAQISEVDAETAAKIKPVTIPPEPDPRIFEILKDCVEHADDEPAKAIGDVLGGIQILRSRVWEIGDRLLHPEHYDSVRVLMGAEVNGRIVDALRLQARSDRLFPFARLETDDSPAPLDLSAVQAAFKITGMNEFKEAEIWNKLTDPFINQCLP